MFDESLTTNQAKADLRVARRAGVFDSNAVAVIVQGYLDGLAIRTQLNE
jgi:RNase H-fold protein (predicted Holliday junction resolvase)